MYMYVCVDLKDLRIRQGQQICFKQLSTFRKTKRTRDQKGKPPGKPR